MDVLWIKTANSYSNWPPLARTLPLSLSGRSSIELCNTSTGKFAAVFLRDCFELSMLGSLFLQHLLPQTELELPAGLNPSTQGTRQPSSCKRQRFRTSSPLQVGLLQALGLQIVVQASGDGLQVETSQYWKFKVVYSEGSCRFSTWCVA